MQTYIEEEEDINNIDSNNLDLLPYDKENISNRVKEIRNSISDLNKELSELILECRHPDGYTLKLITNINGRRMGLRKVCNICDTVIGYPTNQEKDEWCNDGKDISK
jgi:hypothetical protein